MWGLRSLNNKICLISNFIMRCLISQFLHKLVSLDINVLAPSNRFWCADIPLEKLLRWPWLCRSLYIASVWLRSYLCCLSRWLFLRFPCSWTEEIIRVCASWYDHSGMSTSPDDTFVVHDVLGQIFSIMFVLIDSCSNIEVEYCLSKTLCWLTYSLFLPYGSLNFGF